MFFNIVKDLVKRIEGVRRSVNIQIEPESERNFDLAALRKKLLIRCEISRQKNRYIVFQHKLFFNLVKDLFK